jgi:hypothetical protein
VRHDLQHLVLGLAHAHAAHGVAGEVHLHQLVERLLAQVLEHAALHDAEQRVGVLQFRELGLAALGPAQRELHRRAGLAFGGEVALGVIRRAFVELHDDVAVERRSGSAC